MIALDAVPLIDTLQRQVTAYNEVRRAERNYWLAPGHAKYVLPAHAPFTPKAADR